MEKGKKGALRLKGAFERRNLGQKIVK